MSLSSVLYGIVSEGSLRLSLLNKLAKLRKADEFIDVIHDFYLDNLQ
ncbi:hypothetical protein [Paraburkholderia sp. UCT31]|nr:hypothetical protein [Paraburkholderia sp. UCT31]